MFRTKLMAFSERMNFYFCQKPGLCCDKLF